MEETICEMCYSKDLEYNDEHGRFICNICGAMQQLTGIAVTTYENTQNMNFNRLRTYTVGEHQKITQTEKQKIKLGNTKPFKLQELFKWIFDEQVKSMEPYVSNWPVFCDISEKMWEKYADVTGANFDIFTASKDDVRMKNFPLGWGPQYDPQQGSNSVSKATSQLRRLIREQNQGSDCDGDGIDAEKLERNEDKVRIERLVMAKREERKKMKMDHQAKVEEKIEEDDGEIDNGVETVEKENCLESSFNTDSESSEESSLSDEEDPDYIQLDFVDEADVEKVRILRKKEHHNVMWTGSHRRHSFHYMENNLLLLLLSWRFTHSSKTENAPLAISGRIGGLCDILYLVKTKKIPYIHITGLIPSDRFYLNDRVYRVVVLRNNAPSWSVMKQCTSRLMPQMKLSYLMRPCFGSIIERLLIDNNLPLKVGGIIGDIRERTLTLYLPKKYQKKGTNLMPTKQRGMGHKYPETLFPEPLVLTYIFMAVRVALRLDGDFEMRISELVTRLEELGSVPEGKLFVWSRWKSQMYRGTTISNVKDWTDLEEQTEIFDFLEGANPSPTDFVDPPNWNPDYNCLGRRVNKYNPSTEQLRALFKPIHRVLETTMEELKPKEHVPEREFINADIDFLFKPDTLWDTVTMTTDTETQTREVVEEIIRLVKERNWKVQRITSDTIDFTIDIFDDRAVHNLTDLEIAFLQILTRDTGMTWENTVSFIHAVESRYFSTLKPKKKINRKRKINHW